MTETPLDSPADPAPVADAGGSRLRQQAIRGAALLSIRQILVGVVTVGGIVGLPLLLSPAEFSLYGYVNSVVLIGAAIGDLGLGAYIIKNQINDRDLERSLGLQLAFWLLTGCLLLATALTVNPFGFTELTSVLLVTALVLLALQALPTALLEKQMRFKSISAIEIAQRVVLISIALGLAFLNPTEWSIPLAAVVAALIGYPAFMISARWRWRPRLGGGEPLFRGFSSQWWQVRIASQLAYAAYPLMGGLLFSAHDVGLIVWSLSITSIPAYLAPMVARATYPALSRAEPKERSLIYSSLFRGLLVIGMPMIAAILVSAGPVTETVFGSEWAEAVPLLRLESITTMLGIATSSAIPFIFLTAPPRSVKWVCVVTTCAVIALGLALAPLVGFLSISIATIVAVTIQLIIFDRMLRKIVGYRIFKDLTPSFAGLVAGVTLGLPLVLVNGSFAIAILAAIVAASVQIAITWKLDGGFNPKELLASLREREPAAPAS